MLQVVDGLPLYVVDFDTMPALPITWTTDEEKPYALALESAIRSEQITVPGKYGIYMHGHDPIEGLQYDVYSIQE